ncbi:MAG: hypothetical protein OEV49_02250 [candidate division Zixibacteria bacterium]|nr:hypothetical protein [candidate division Zixibacteria bacterium]
MRRRSIIVVCLLIVGICSDIHSAGDADEARRSSRLVDRSLHYSFPAGRVDGETGQPLGLVDASTDAVGTLVGDTWWDMQHYGSMGRMVDWGHDSLGGLGFMVHFNWMRLETSSDQNRHYAYNAYYSEGGSAGTFLGQEKIQPNGEYAGFVGIDVTSDGRVVLGGHNNYAGYNEASHFYWDFGPGFAFFGMNRRIPDSTGWINHGGDTLVASRWPKFRYQDSPGHDPVLHVLVVSSEGVPEIPKKLTYWRKVGADDTGDWDWPSWSVDTVFNIAYDLACSNTSAKVALVWLANLPDPGDCDTCSSQQGRPFPNSDNDLYFQISHNHGAPTSWQPRVNLTQNVDGQEGYRPYTDVSALIDTQDDFHVAWGGRVWPADANSGGDVDQTRSRVFHWGENLGYYSGGGNVRTVAHLEYDQSNCDGGAWQLNGSKMSLSECEGKLYCLWTQFIDPYNEAYDDCAERAFGGSGISPGAANGDLHLAISDDGGLTWSSNYNLTNTYTPHCDSASGSGGRCRSEHWASMARFGTNLTGSDMSQSVTIDPSGQYTGDHFLDVMFIDDADPGAAVLGEGSYQQAEVRWFRLACIEPRQGSGWRVNWTDIDYPEYTKHGTQYDKLLTIENLGNITTDFSTTLNEDPGPYSDWLSISPELQSGSIPPGANNILSGTVTINAGGTINLPGTIISLTGSMTFEGNMIGSPYVFPIDFLIVDTIYLPAFDTVTTGCLSLVVSNSGNFGNQGVGHVNLDFFDYGDCDDLEDAEDTIPGNATVYLYDASPVICWTDATDTVRCNFSIWGTTYLSDDGFVPLDHSVSTQFLYGTDLDDNPLYYPDVYMSRFVTHDTSLLIEKWWIHPDQSASQGSNFIIQAMRITSADGQTHTGLNIGEAIDWDIPSDSASRNRSGFSAAVRLVYQWGTEYHDDPEECQENSDRYGGIELLRIIECDGQTGNAIHEPYGAWTGSSPLWVYPAGGFIPEELDSLMTNREGYVLSDSVDSDLHSVMTYLSGYTLAPSDLIMIYSCLITSRLGYAAFIASAQDCREWYRMNLIPPSNGCCMGPGNVNYDPGGAIDISDLVYLVDYMFSGGPPPPCFEEGDMNADGLIDISDLVYFVDFMFTGGPPPQPCGAIAPCSGFQ